MKKSRSRIIALLLSLVYCFTLATGVVFAEEVEEPAPVAQTRDLVSYTVTFDADGGTPEPENAVVQKGHKVPKPTDPEKAGFIFTGWHKVYSAGGVEEEEAWNFDTALDIDPELDQNLHLIAKYEKAYTITFDLNGGEYAGDDADLEVKVSEGGELPDAPAEDDLSKEGYKFAGWYVGETAYEGGTDTSATEDLTVVAKWDKQWNVTFNTDGGKPIEPMVVDDGYQLNVAGISAEKTGFTLEKWIIQPGGETAPLQLVIDKDTELQAVWKADDEDLVTLTFDSAGGTAVPAQTINKGTAPTKPEDPTREGKVFVNWFAEGVSAFPFKFDAALNEDTLVIAKWEDAVTVTFDSNGGTPVKSENIAKGKPVEKPEDPTKEGFRFLGWYVNLTDESEYDFATRITDNLTLVAKWQEFHVVTFDANGGYILVGEDQLPSQDVEINHNADIVEGNAPAAERDGFTFKHWSLEGTDTKFEFSPNPIVKDITLVAQWTVNEYTVSFGLGGGKWVETDEEGNEVYATEPDPKEVTVEYNTLVPTDEMPADPVKEGFKFDGWLLENGEPFDANALITENTIVKPNWTEQVVVTFALDGGKWSDGSNEAKKVQVDKGKEVAQPENPAKEHARFDGWKTEDNDPYNFEWPVRGNLTITAKWVDQAIIKFDTQG
ncbi:MAG TPA: InlB B-repeat-containing protein, partial [Clostridiaceae bacterium]|nr:InlB B-repeat-containing protein [Clostridiaceae bacterium]